MSISSIFIWAHYDNSLINLNSSAILGWFPLLTMISSEVVIIYPDFWIEIAQGSRTWCCAGLEAHVGDLARTKPTCTLQRGDSWGFPSHKHPKKTWKCHQNATQYCIWCHLFRIHCALFWCWFKPVRNISNFISRWCEWWLILMNSQVSYPWNSPIKPGIFDGAAKKWYGKTW